MGEEGSETHWKRFLPARADYRGPDDRHVHRFGLLLQHILSQRLSEGVSVGTLPDQLGSQSGHQIVVHPTGGGIDHLLSEKPLNVPSAFSVTTRPEEHGTSGDQTDMDDHCLNKNRTSARRHAGISAPQLCFMRNAHPASPNDPSNLPLHSSDVT